MVFTTFTKTPTLCTPTLSPPTGGDPKWIGVSSDPPFTLSGAPVTATPQSVPRQSVNYCTGLDDSQTSPQPLRTQLILDTSGLIKDPVLNSGTTLRITNESVAFNLAFIALHKDIWSDTAAGPQLSLFFTGRAADGSTVYTHICIPVTYTTDDLNTNLFLKSWLKNTPPPSGLTVNNLLDAKRGLKFQVMYYCLGGSSSWNSYNLFLSYEPLLLNRVNLPGWLVNDNSLIESQWSSSTYRLKTFSDMYTVAMNVRSPTNTEFLNWENLTGTETTPPAKKFVSILDGTKTQSGITPSYYVLPPGSLSGTAVTTGLRTIPKKQIKCYPINLMKDVDKNGNVIVDSNNVPMTTTRAANEKAGEIMNLKLDDTIVKGQNATLIMGLTVVGGILSVILILGIVIWFFGGKQSPSDIPTVGAAGAAGSGAAAILPNPLPPPPGMSSLPLPLPAPPGMPSPLPPPLPAPPGATP